MLQQNGACVFLSRIFNIPPGGPGGPGVPQVNIRGFLTPVNLNIFFQAPGNPRHPFPEVGEGKNPIKIIWTLQGWAAPETLLYCDYNNNNLEEFTDVAKAVRTTPTILEVQGLSSLVSLKNLKRITDLVEQQGEKLASCEWTGLDLYVNTDEFFVLQRMSMKWKASRLKVSVGGGWNRKLAEFAGSSLDNGHIGSLVVTWYQEQGAVNLTALKRVWEIADEMRIHKNRFDLLLNVGGGRGEDRDEAWQLVLNLFLP